eukprot:gene8574-9447_t
MTRRPGLQSGEEFGRHERELKRWKEEELVQATSSVGPNREATVYRDKLGRRVDGPSDQLRQEQRSESQRKERIVEAQYEWGRGSVQKREARDAQEEFAAVAAEPFARTADNPRLEKMRKEVILDGDPMAQYFRTKRKKDSEVSGDAKGGKRERAKPLYSGPNPTPNRFNIRPGYRWDAIDRGNGFEARALRKRSEREAFDEEAYKWAVSDL